MIINKEIKSITRGNLINEVIEKTIKKINIKRI